MTLERRSTAERGRSTRALLRTLIGSLAVLALAGSLTAEEPDHAGAETVIVGVTSTRLVPPVLEMRSDQAVAWLGYGAAAFVVSFEDEIAREMHCTKPVSFRLEGNRLEAAIGSGEFASFCRLDPGEYEYEVCSGPRRLAGKLVVR